MALEHPLIPEADIRELTRDQAAALDRALPDIDWHIPDTGFARCEFAGPSGRLAAVQAGDPDAPRVVLVPGVTGSKEDFLLVIPILVRAGFHVVSFDLAGQYESADAGPENLDPPRAHYDEALFVDDLVAVIASVPGPVHLLGHSFAGIVAQLVTIARPDLVRSLALLGSPPFAGQVFRHVKVVGAVAGAASPALAAELMTWGVRNNLNRAQPGRVALVRERFTRTRPDSVRDVMGLMMHAPDTAAAVRATGVPALVTAGTHDLWRAADQRVFADRLGARLSLYETGHSPCETAPHQLARDLVALYDAADGRSA